MTVASSRFHLRAPRALAAHPPAPPAPRAKPDAPRQPPRAPRTARTRGDEGRSDPPPTDGAPTIERTASTLLAAALPTTYQQGDSFQLLTRESGSVRRDLPS